MDEEGLSNPILVCRQLYPAPAPAHLDLDRHAAESIHACYAKTWDASVAKWAKVCTCTLGNESAQATDRESEEVLLRCFLVHLHGNANTSTTSEKCRQQLRERHHIHLPLQAETLGKP